MITDCPLCGKWFLGPEAWEAHQRHHLELAGEGDGDLDVAFDALVDAVTEEQERIGGQLAHAFLRREGQC